MSLQLGSRLRLAPPVNIHLESVHGRINPRASHDERSTIMNSRPSMRDLK